MQSFRPQVASAMAQELTNFLRADIEFVDIHYKQWVQDERSESMLYYSVDSLQAVHSALCTERSGSFQYLTDIKSDGPHPKIMDYKTVSISGCN